MMERLIDVLLAPSPLEWLMLAVLCYPIAALLALAHILIIPERKR